MTMNSPRTKRVASVTVSLAAVAAITLGSFGVASSVNAEPTPTATASARPFVGSAENGLAAEQEAEAAAAVEAARVEAERIAAEQAAAAAAEAARVEAERIAAAEAQSRAEAEAAVREQAAQRQAARTSPSTGTSSTEQAPAPEAPRRCPGGSTADESDGYNDTRCTPLFANNGGSCFEGTNYESGGCEPFRP